MLLVSSTTTLHVKADHNDDDDNSHVDDSKDNYYDDDLVVCTADEDCNHLNNDPMTPPFVCMYGTCRNNPYESGCLRAKLGSKEGNNNNKKKNYARKFQDNPKYYLRMCNSDDETTMIGGTTVGSESGLCRIEPLSDNFELRMHTQNWEASIFEVWILQIVLSEVLNVPTTLETGTPTVHLNFYDPLSRFDYGKSSDYKSLVTSSQVIDCRDVLQPHSLTEENYVSCAHTVTEVWDADEDAILNLLKANSSRTPSVVLEKPQVLGVLGEEAIYMPKFTVERDPSLLNYIGLQGLENRHKLAQMFLRPTTWGDYCAEVSTNNCTQPDDVAQYGPPTMGDTTRMFAGEDGVAYTGYFRATDENNCTKYPTNCTGHIADYPCGWPSFVEQQMYHLDIGLQSSGRHDNPYSRGYTYSQLYEIWLAANYTKSNTISMWYKPETLYQSFLNTDSELMKVTLPPRTQQCIDSRVSIEDRCNPDPEVRRGSKDGACDNTVQQLHKLIVSTLYPTLYNNPTISDGQRSPAYDVVSLFTMTSEQLGSMFDLWQSSGGTSSGDGDEDEDSTNQIVTTPRDAVCEWVVQNMDLIVEKFIPRTYPRYYEAKNEFNVFMYISTILASVGIIMVLLTTAGVYTQRRRRVIRVAQVEFLWLLVAGLFLICCGALLNAIPPTNTICVIDMWLINVGYTLELVPLIVKVAAINQLLHAARRMRRVKLTRTTLFGAVCMILVLIVIFSIVWTLYDPPMKSAEYILTDNETPDGEYTIVEIQYSCTSTNIAFDYINLGWTSLLLFIATILAFQTRNLRQDFNESQTLGIMIYSHFLFVLLRMITFFLSSSLISGAILSKARSIIYSCDAIATICIYFVPKFMARDDMADGQSTSDFFSASPNRRNSAFGHQMSFLNGKLSLFRFSRGPEPEEQQPVSPLSSPTTSRVTNPNMRNGGGGNYNSNSSCMRDPFYSSTNNMSQELSKELTMPPEQSNRGGVQQQRRVSKVRFSTVDVTSGDDDDDVSGRDGNVVGHHDDERDDTQKTSTTSPEESSKNDGIDHHDNDGKDDGRVQRSDDKKAANVVDKDAGNDGGFSGVVGVVAAAAIDEELLEQLRLREQWIKEKQELQQLQQQQQRNQQHTEGDDEDDSNGDNNDDDDEDEEWIEA